MSLWEHQARGIALASDAFRTHRRVLLVIPTGGGKTRTAVHIIGAHLAKPARSVLFMVHRTELVRQTVAALVANGMAREDMRSLAGEETWGREDAPVCVASVQTLLARGIRPSATLVIPDEAHHYVSPEWCGVFESYQDAHILGLTATPERADGRPLGDLFDVIVAPTSVRELTAAGHLVPCTVFAPSARQSALAQHPHDALRTHRDRWRKAVVFCANIEHAEAVARDCAASGLRAGVVHSETEDRADVLAQLRAGALDVVTNVFVLTEGYDDTSIDCIVMARGCTTVAAWLQSVGRSLRCHAGKKGATVLDLVGAVHEHGLPDEDREWSLEGRASRLASDQPPPLRQCRACGAVYRPGPPTCPRCGAAVPPPPKPKLKREELQQIMSAHTVDKRVETWRRLQATARERGYKPGWAAFQFKVRYGHWPNAAMRGEGS